MSDNKKIELESVKKFLDSEAVDFNEIKSINQISKLPVSSYKFISENDGEIIKELFKISKISEFLKLSREDPFKKVSKSKKKKAILSRIKESDPDFEEKIKKAITISVIIERLRRKLIKVEPTDQKVIVVGLNNAGKTAILSQFGGRFGIKTLASLKPTRGIQRQEIKTEDMNLHIWDFGGQKDHRDDYLQAPEEYFFKVNLVIYVIDIQDSDRYDESIDYFIKIIENLIKMEEFPQILIFLHKFDPDLKENEEILLSIEFLKDLVKSALKDKGFQSEIFLSSIYSMISKEPKFSKIIKDFMQDSSLAEPDTLTIDDLGKMMESTLNAIVQLSTSLMHLEERFEKVEKPIRSILSIKEFQKRLPLSDYSAFIVPPPPPPPPESLSAKNRPLSLRETMIRELRETFIKRDLGRFQ